MAETVRKRWVVVGADMHTGETKQMTIESVSADRAEATARKSGLLVSSVQPEGALNYTAAGEVLPEREPGAYVESVSAGAAFKLGFFGGLGAMASWVVLWCVIGLILMLLGFSLGAAAKLFGL